MPRHMALTLTTDERTELERRTRSRELRAEDARRAQVILMLADGGGYDGTDGQGLARRASENIPSLRRRARTTGGERSIGFPCLPLW